MEPHVDTLSDRDFTRVVAFVGAEAGIHLGEHKREMVQARLSSRIRSLGVEGFSAYMRYAFESEMGVVERPRLLDALTTNKTEFFREADHFRFLTEHALPALLRDDPGLRAGGQLNVWSAGCSTGEEPYTIAMVLSEYAIDHRGPGFAIFASDICGDALSTARRAVYSDEKLLPVSEQLRKRYFLRSKDPARREYRAAPELRARVRFARANLVKDPAPFAGQCDIVFCRNALIYFDRTVQAKVIAKFSRAVRPGGYLFLGHSETLQGFDAPFELAAPAVYRRVGA